MPRKARSHRLRIGRVSESGRVYLITITCHQRHAHFAALQSGRCFVPVSYTHLTLPTT